MFVWRELEDGDTITIKREDDRVSVSIVRPRTGRDEQRATMREVKLSADDVITTLVRCVLQRLKNHQ